MYTVTAMIKPPPLTSCSTRIHGLDLARALAIFGMVIVNYELSMDATGQGPAWLGVLTSALHGRAAGTFVVLAGIGASLGSARARLSGRADERRSARKSLLTRGAFLFLLGTAFLPVWPADILHFYGVYLTIGAALLFAPGGALVAAAITSVFIGLMFLLLGDWGTHWNFTDLTYQGLWTPMGFLRALFLDGFHPVFPWVSLYIFGMLIGRGSLASRAWRRRIGFAAAGVLVLIELGARIWAPVGIETPGWGALIATDSLPPAPGYLIAAAATAVIVIVLCCEIAERVSKRVIAPFEATGRLALSFYLGHILVGLGVLEELGMLENQTLPFAVGASIAFFVAAVLFAWLWTKRYARGPLEALMRRIAG